MIFVKATKDSEKAGWSNEGVDNATLFAATASYHKALQQYRTMNGSG